MQPLATGPAGAADSGVIDYRIPNPMSDAWSGSRALAAIAAASLLGGCGYGRIQELDEAVLEARSEIEVQLQRRSALVPNLLETVQSYGAVAEEVIAGVADARAGLVGAVRSGQLPGMETASAELSGALEELLTVVSRTPALDDDRGFRLLRSQLEQTEEMIIQAGRSYNEAVRRYNDFIEQFPQMVTAKVIGAEALELFEPWDGPASLSSADE